MVCVGPLTFCRTTGWPGATLPPWFTHSYVADTLGAVRKAAVGPFPSPAAFPLQVNTPVVAFFVHVGVPMKCGLSAKAADATIASVAHNPAPPARTRLMRALLPLGSGLLTGRGPFGRPDRALGA